MSNNNSLDHRVEKLITDRTGHDFESQVTEAIKIVEEIDCVDSRLAYQRVMNKVRKRSGFTELINTLSRVAAVFFIPLLITSGFLFYHQSNRKDSQQYALQEITSPVGVRSRVVLPDGSNVWLNGASTIKFKVPFDQKNRDVSLSGEAFFDVHKNPDLPFIVSSGDVKVKVLGTRFNYSAFEGHNIEIVLAEGKISLTTDGEKRSNEVILKPGDRAVFDKSSAFTRITNEKIEKYIAWHDGKLVFDETPMPEVAAQISRWFGVDVVVSDPKIKSYRITTTFENESLYQVLELLRLSSPIEIKYIQATFNKTNQVQTKSKVIFSNKTKI